MNRGRNRIVAALLCLFLSITAAIPAAATNGSSLSGVTDEMGKASYWQKLSGSDGDEVWLSPEQITALNQATMDASGTMVFDLEHYAESSNADELKTSCANITVPTRDLYIDGKKIDNQTYFTALSRAVKATGYSGASHANQYAIVTSLAGVYAIPSDDVIGYSADDPDSEYQSDSIVVGEPFIILQKCAIDGKVFYWGVYKDLSGWVNAEDVAICANKEEWLNAWKVETDGKDFVVVTQNEITTELSRSRPNTSGRKLTLGTVLKLVPEKDIPTSFGERSSFNNYVVYLPVRQADGSFTREAALISQHYSLSEGYLPLTENNLLSIALTRLGDRYGWGNMLDSWDCSGYTRLVYSCFGIILPRNTTYQQRIPGTKISLSGLTDEEKLQILRRLPAGTCLYFPGHTMLLLGMEGDMPYAISAVGGLSDSEGEVEVQNAYSVIITPLSVRRRNGSTWLSNLDAAVVLKPFESVEDWTVTVTRTDASPVVTVKSTAANLRAGTDYVLSCTEDHVAVFGCGAYLGVSVTQIPEFNDVPTNHEFYSSVAWAVEQNITSGTDSTHFSPNAITTRAQMVTFLWRAAGSPEPTLRNLPFADVREDSYYYKAALWAAENGLVSGADENHFSPEEPLTRAQAVTILNRIAAAEPSESSAFTDVPNDSYYANAVAWAVANGITSGTSATTFSPDAACTRGQVVTFLYRYSCLSDA